MKLSLPPKLVEKLVWVPIISFSKISFLVKDLMAYYAETDLSSSNQLTLQITLVYGFTLVTNYVKHMSHI
jgi:hypothetical protein